MLQRHPHPRNCPSPRILHWGCRCDAPVNRSTPVHLHAWLQSPSPGEAGRGRQERGFCQACSQPRRAPACTRLPKGSCAVAWGEPCSSSTSYSETSSRCCFHHGNRIFFVGFCT